MASHTTPAAFGHYLCDGCSVFHSLAIPLDKLQECDLCTRKYCLETCAAVNMEESYDTEDEEDNVESLMVCKRCLKKKTFRKKLKELHDRVIVGGAEKRHKKAKQKREAEEEEKKEHAKATATPPTLGEGLHPSVNVTTTTTTTIVDPDVPNPIDPAITEAALCRAPGLIHRKFNRYTSWGDEIRIVQFNTLADGLSGLREDKGGFADPDKTLDGILKWSSRFPRLVHEIRDCDPHIICLQEVDHPGYFNHVFVAKGHYSMVFEPKPHSPCLEVSNEPDGCVILYDTRRFKAVNTDDLCFKLGPEDNQVAACVVLQDLGHPDERYVVCSAHFKAAKTEEGERTRHRQMVTVTMTLDDIAIHHQASGVFLCTDMNGKPSEAAYQICIAGSLTRNHMKSAMHTLTGQEPEFTTWKKRGPSTVKHTIDYIFYRSTILAPDRYLEIPPAIGCIPSKNYPSDHVMLCAAFARMGRTARGGNRGGTLLEE